jgi:hypothetical protein
VAYKARQYASRSDGVIDRYFELLLNDKTPYDEKVADIVSDYINSVSELKDLTDEAIDGIGNANKKKDLKSRLETILKTEAKSSHRGGGPREYQDLIKGRFEINVIRIERTSNIENDISNKLFDYSTDTIKQLTKDGFEDVMMILNKQRK